MTIQERKAQAEKRLEQLREMAKLPVEAIGEETAMNLPSEIRSWELLIQLIKRQEEKQ